MIIRKSLDYLIQQFRRDNPILAEILTSLSNQGNALTDQNNLDESILINFEYRFELGGVLTVANDIYPVWKQVRFPLNDVGNTIGTGQQITRIDINAKVASITGPAVLDILVTKDKGISFTSLFGPDISQKLILPQNLNWIKYGGKFILSADILQDGWWFRIDGLTADGVCEAIEIVIRGTLNL